MCVCVNNMARVALDGGKAEIRTSDLVIASRASKPLGHQATHFLEGWAKYEVKVPTAA